MIEEKFIELIAHEASTTPARVTAAIELLDGGATIPFIAKYRKDAVGNLSESKLETIQEARNHAIGVVGRRKAILDALEKQNQLTEELRARIEACTDKAALDDAFLPFKTKRGAKAAIAEEHGLEPLADFIMKQLPGLQNVEEFADAFVKPERSVSSVEEALEGARHIMSERFTIDPEARNLIRDFMLKEGVITVKATKNAVGTKTRYEALYDLSEPFTKIPSAKLLAILRGLKEGFLRVDISIDEVKMFNILLDKFLQDPNSVFGPHIRLALSEAYARHLRPSTEKDVLEVVKKRANDEVILSCCETARNHLLAAPAGKIFALGVVPESKASFTFAVINADGAFVESKKAAFGAAAPAEENGEAAQASPTVQADEALPAAIQEYSVRAIVVGTGSGSRDIARAINELLGKLKIRGVNVVIMTSGPAAAYASSRLAKEEFPENDAATREAISLARRIQDPLLELVRVEPRALGLGQQQYDVNQKQLRDALFATITSCVSRVGANVNQAPLEMLRYISGLQMSSAQKLVEKRQELGGLKSRAQLMEVDGIGPKVFEQCAGFLRIVDGENPLDATSVHPELYGIVEKLAQSIEAPVSALIGNEENLAKLDPAPLAGDGLSSGTFAELRRALSDPQHDPRGAHRAPRFRDGVASIDTIQEGMDTEGVVTNVADFGAFVDIGVQQDGLIHLSELSNRFVKNPKEVINIGDVVKVKIIKIDKEKDTPRISLSIKALLPQAPPRRRPAQHQQAEGDTQAQPDAVPGEPAREQRPRRGADAPRSRTDRDEAQRTRPQRGGERRERDRDRDRGSRGSDKSSRGADRSSRPKEDKRGMDFGDAGVKINTLLADQLAAMKERFK
jgi:uncharacterized protein